MVFGQQCLATAVFALNRLIDIPYSMGAHAYDVFEREEIGY